MEQSTYYNNTPAETLGWEPGRVSGAQAWALEETDIVAQHDADGWGIWLEHAVYGLQWLETVESWSDVLDWINARPSSALICADLP